MRTYELIEAVVRAGSIRRAAEECNLTASALIRRIQGFEQEFGDGSKFGLQVDYVVEDEPLGTGGGIANVADKLRYDTALVFNGDVQELSS